MLLLTILFLLILLLAFAGLILFMGIRAKASVARALDITLLFVKVPRETPEKEVDKQKQEKERISVIEQLFASFANFHTKGFKKILYGDPYLVLELAIDPLNEDIHFYIGVPRAYEGVVEKQIHGFYPTASVVKTKDYNIFNSGGASVGGHVSFTNHPMLPFRTYQKLEADPLGAILTAFSKLDEQTEGAAMQIIMQPARNSALKKFSGKVSRELQKGHDFKDAVYRAKRNEFLHVLGGVVVELFTPGSKGNSQEKKMRDDERKVATSYHEELAKSVVNKSSKALFNTNIRLLASAANEMRANQILQDMEGAFVQFSAPDLNSLRLIRAGGRSFKKLVYEFSFRIFNRSEALVCSTEEVASLYHFALPTTVASKLHLLRAKPAEPPTNLPNEGIILGRNLFRGQEKMIRMLPEDRRRHLYVIGQTGTGKSTFIKNLVIQDILAGEGVAVVDPHGDLVDDILGFVPPERADDVILFNPGDIARPLGLNILEIDPDQPQQKSFVIDDFYKIIKTIYKDLPEAFGPIFEKFFKNTLMLLLDDYKNEIPTIAEISRVFADKDYRDAKLDRETNPEIIRFWRFEAEKMSGDWSLPNMSGYITSKLAPFILNEYVRPIITQQKSSFNFREVMDSKKILLVNLSKGLIGELNANLLGMIIVSKILVAAFSRVDTEQEARKDFYLYIDEFQNFTTDSIATILSEARKYRLNLSIAHQFIKQLEEKIRDAVFGNVGSMTVFRVGADDAEFLKNKFDPVFSPQDLMNIDNFNAYMNLLIKNQTTRPFNMQVLAPDKPNLDIARGIKELSRLKYGRRKEEVEKEFRDRQGFEDMV